MQYWVEPSFNSAYQKWCASRAIKPDIINISSQTYGYWLGSSSSKAVLVFFHGMLPEHIEPARLQLTSTGGGFAFPANSGHLSFLSSIKDSMEAQGLSLSVLIVDYPLTPLTTFPTQFQEAVNAVRYVLETCGFEPSQIIIGGDSAGGNLAAAVVLHCVQPSDLVAPLAAVSSASRFRGLVLLSPWVSFDVTLQSFTKPPGKDYIQAASEKAWSDSYLNESGPCIYSEPGLASATQWKDIPVQDILVTAGADELLLDGITKWVDDIKVLSSHSSLNIVA
ncbi:hypothetical protein LTR84_003235 [Exophiala bonariae]|uniref:Alpha/beta hydrolase fold-3 domain-containing protein n=1 Tax=Exophiala bonariae TaxID=1690606 RepID=A0AAV9N950_9EURO|nr:hypothetical protein LTR84_003235 [Exophiala bonariae]